MKFLALFLWVLTGFLAFAIESAISREAHGFDQALSRVFGSAKEAIGDTLFLKADVYYHGGVEEKFEETVEDLEKEGRMQYAPTDGTPSDWIAKINSRIKGAEHVHLTREKQKEMLPFFAIATSLNPHNLPAILTTAYWLEYRFDKTDAAIGVLEKGAENNPEAWEIDYELANIYFKRRQDYAASERFYLRALSKFPDGAADKHARGNLYYFLAESCARQGKKEEAAEAYRNALQSYDPKEAGSLLAVISDKIQKLYN